jgi:aerobic carbon-monoxide dehydrogenase medium subunit
VKMAAFVYHRPETVDEVLALLGEHGPDSKILAGGQSLLPVMAMRLATPGHLIDIGRVRDADKIDTTGNGISFGSRVRHSDVEDSTHVAQHVPLVSQAMPLIGHRAIRNRGTLCGSLAHADPAAELPAIALALGAEFTVRSKSATRTVPADKFFHGYLSTDIADNEFLTEVRIPPASPRSGSCILEMSRRHGDYAVAGCAVHLGLDERGSIAHVAMALFGVASQPVRIASAESLLVGHAPTDEAIGAAASQLAKSIDPPADDHGTKAFRRHLVASLTKRALRQAVNHAGGPS